MAAVFSYAEAAKGLTPAAPIASADKSVGQPPSEVSFDAEAKVNLTVGKTKTSLAVKTDAVSSFAPSTTEKDHVGTSDHSEPKETSNPNTSEDVSPSFGGDSIATLLKDDDTTGPLHDGSDSTVWEKISQDSNALDRASRADAESNDSKSSAWEHPQTPSLKDAPPPAVNPWTKRAQDIKAKTSVSSTIRSTSESTNATGKKKSRLSISEPGIVRAERVIDSKPKGGEAPVRRYKPASETRAASHLPPPASDAVSWPTPDLAAKPEDRKKSTPERSDSAEAEKEKIANAKHGKKEWVSMPFVPNAVFNTPIPTGRRGGRPGPRGGRDGGPGRGPSNGSAAERTDRSPSAQRGDDSIDGSKTDAPSFRQGNMNRQKRMSNAGQNRPRDFRRGEDGREDRHQRSADTEAVSNKDPAKDGQRPAPASEAGDPARRHAASGGSFRSNAVNGSPADYANGPIDFGVKGSERRFESSQSPRENGFPREARSERGGRPFRGRGGHAGIPGHHQNVYANGTGYQYGPGFSPTKSAHEQRQGQQGNFGAGREGRHVRTGSRSQQGPPQQHVPRYGMNPAMAVGFQPMAPEMAAGYGFVPGMAPQFYHPYQDQQGLVSMIMEQMRYWFSFENLIRDQFLRKRMDDNGFVPLSFLMPWKRMQQLTSDVKMVRFACQHVPQIELRVDHEGNEYVRKAHDWDKWVFPLAERHEQAQKDGSPQLFTVFPFAEMSHSSPGFDKQHKWASKPSNKLANGVQQQQPAAPVTDEVETMNGEANSGSQTPLSATVPEFKPEGLLESKVHEVIIHDNTVALQYDEAINQAEQEASIFD